LRFCLIWCVSIGAGSRGVWRGSPWRSSRSCAKRWVSDLLFCSEFNSELCC
jgi:hypothetical protein